MMVRLLTLSISAAWVVDKSLLAGFSIGSFRFPYYFFFDYLNRPVFKHFSRKSVLQVKTISPIDSYFQFVVWVGVEAGDCAVADLFFDLQE